MEFSKMPVVPRFVIAAPFVIADSIRNPVHAWHWIPDRVRDDKGRVQDDKGVFIFPTSQST